MNNYNGEHLNNTGCAPGAFDALSHLILRRAFEVGTFVIPILVDWKLKLTADKRKGRNSKTFL